MLQPGDTFAGCKIITQCGHGAYGHVYLATDALGHRVAVKLLLTPDAGEYELKGLRNYISLATPHPALLRVFLCGMENGLPFYVMEAADDGGNGTDYVPDTLALRLRRQGRIPAQEALLICHTLLDGLEAMHQHNLLHRDVKPENIIFVDGHPKLADPGLTRNFAQTLSVAGTPGYIAPELFSGEGTVSPCTDLYALGKLLYHIVTGLPPEKFPSLPEDIPVDELYQVCRPLTRICCADPTRRCQTCAECRAALPKVIQPHGPLLRFRDSLYMRASFRHRTLVRIACALFCVLLVTLAVLGVKMHRQRQRRLFQQKVDDARAKLNEVERHFPALEWQLEALHEPLVWTPDALQQFLRLLENGQPDEAVTLLNGARDKLTELAVKHLPQNTASDFQSCADGWGYLDSPLGRFFLPSEQQTALRQRLQRESGALADGDRLRLGSDFREAEHTRYTLAFIPPGIFHSQSTFSVRRMTKPFWIMTKELSGEQFAHTSSLPLRSNSPQQAAEFLSWNDALEYCRRMTQMLSCYHNLPEGYGVRPPTEAEWEYAAYGGWNAKPIETREIPAGTKNQIPGQGTPNSRGLYNMDDNLSEIVQPYSDKPFAFRDAVAIRGARYNSRHTGLAERNLYILDQCHMEGGGGLRPMLGPMPKDFYERSWYRGPTIQPCTIDGAVYAGWSLCFASISWKNAVDLAANVGGRLPETTDLNAIKDLFQRVALIESFPCHLGIRCKDGQWTRISDGKVVSLTGKSLKKNKHLDCLGTTASQYYPVTEKTVLPTLLLCWDSETAFRDRLRNWLDKATLASFSVDGRSFVVCRATMAGYAVRSFVKFMGARQPVLPSADSVRQVIAHLPTSQKVALGPTRFYSGQWEQSDSSVTNYSDLSIDDQHTSQICPRTLFALVAWNGQAFLLDYVDAILLER